jgi:hypothetical protein
MAIRGWVYVITNKSMPDLVKIGFSTKDPMLRADELGNTGSPANYCVVYDVLVEDPQKIEQCVHKILAHKNEGKEWFRCEISEAVNEIRTVIGERAFVEKYSDDIANIETFDNLPAVNETLKNNYEFRLLMGNKKRSQ